MDTEWERDMVLTARRIKDVVVLTLCLIGAESFVLADGLPSQGVYITSADYPPLPTYATSSEHLYWISGPAAPGDPVLVTGAFNTNAKKARIARIPDGTQDWKSVVGKSSQLVAVSTLGPTGISFRVPASMSSGLYGFRLEDGSASPVMGLINTPELYWAQGLPPEGHTEDITASVLADGAVPGGTLRIFGRSFTPGLTATLTSTQTKGVRLTPTVESAYAAAVTLPATLSPGPYVLHLGDSQDSTPSQSNSVAFTVTAPNAAVVRSVDASGCGVVGDGVTDNATALQNCLDQNAGATPVAIHFSAGTFLFTKPIQLSTNEYLVGESSSTTTLAAATTGKLPMAWVTGGTSFGLLRLSLTGPVIVTLLSSNPSAVPGTFTSGHILIDHASLRATTFDSAHAGQAVLVRLGGPDIRVVNSEIAGGSNVFLGLTGSAGVLVSNNSFNLGQLSWYSFGNCHDGIVENNRIVGIDPQASGGSYSTHPGALSDNFYTTGNLYQNLHGNNREAFTTDGGGGGYLGRLSSINGGTLTLSNDPVLGAAFLPDTLAIAIMAGPGIGQYRFIHSLSGRVLTLDKPFTVQPDATSAVSIFAAQRHYIFEKNKFEDTGVAVQFYGDTLDSIVADNDMTATHGIGLWGLHYFRGYLPTINVQVLGNRMIGDALKDNATGKPQAYQTGVHLQVNLRENMILGVLIHGDTISPSGVTTFGGELTRLFSILDDVPTIVTVDPPAFHYATESLVLSERSPMATLRPLVTGGTPARYVVTPMLASGLSLNAATGEISGTPTTLLSPTVYQIVGSNAAGEAHVSLQIDIGVNHSGSQPVTLGSDLSRTRVYPNPWRIDRHAPRPVTFASMPVGSTVKIFTIAGRHVKTLDAPDGIASWDLANDSGALVGSDVYIYLVSNNGNSVHGKLAVIR